MIFWRSTAARTAAALAILGAAGIAHADVAVATTNPPVPLLGTASGGSGAINNTRLGTPLDFVGGSAGSGARIVFDGSGGGTASFTNVGVRFDTNHDANLDFVLWLAPSTGTFTATLDSILMQDSSGNSITVDYNQVLTSSSTAGETVANRILFGSNLGVLSSVGDFDGGDFEDIYFNITFTGTNAGEAFEIDFVTNPEPGTLALFGLGLLGLGGVVVRRRKKALALEATDGDETLDA